MFFGIRDPGSGMWKNPDPGSGINIPDPQHWMVHWGSCESQWCSGQCGSGAVGQRCSETVVIETLVQWDNVAVRQRCNEAAVQWDSVVMRWRCSETAVQIGRPWDGSAVGHGCTSVVVKWGSGGMWVCYSVIVCLPFPYWVVNDTYRLLLSSWNYIETEELSFFHNCYPTLC